MRRPRPHISPATVIASIALLIVLGGTSAAAVELTLPRNSVGAPQLKNGAVTNLKLAGNAVTSSKVANGSLLRADFKAGQVPPGAPGPPGNEGARGPTGPTGTAGPSSVALWAVINPNGTAARQSGVLSVGHPGTGNYRVRFNKNITACAWLATIGSATTVTSFGLIETELASGSTDTVHVEVRDFLGNTADRGFHLAVIC